MLLVEVAKISDLGLAIEGEESGELLELAGDPYTREIGPIRYRLFAEKVSREVVVRGTVETELERACLRCGEFYSTTVMDSSFLRAYDVSAGVESIDVTPGLREAILLYLPTFSRCKPDCMGLCHQCGRNLNLGPCSCAPPPEKGRLDGLGGLCLEEDQDAD